MGRLFFDSQDRIGYAIIILLSFASSSISQSCCPHKSELSNQISVSHQDQESALADTQDKSLFFPSSASISLGNDKIGAVVSLVENTKQHSLLIPVLNKFYANTTINAP